MIEDEIKSILLDNILSVFSDKTFSKDLSAEIVGGEGKLISLIENGKIAAEKHSCSQNGKWQCNAAQVLMNCRSIKKVSKRK